MSSAARRRSGTVAGLVALTLTGGAAAYGASVLLQAQGLGTVNDEAVVIPRVQPTVTGAPVPGSITAGQSARSSATLLNGTTTASGVVQHRLYRAADSACATPVASATSAAAGRSASTSGPVAPAAGSYTWRVDYDGDSRNAPAVGTCGNGGTLTVQTPAPTAAALAVTAVSPSTGGRNGTRAVTLSGTGFVAGATITISGAGVTSSATSGSGTSLSATFTTAASADLGARTVTVRNPDGTTAQCTGCFTVQPAPTASGSTPNSNIPRDGSTIFTVSGTGFVSGVTATTSNTSDFQVTAVQYVSATQVRVTVANTSGNNGNGTANLIITNPDGGTVTLTGALTR